LIGITGKKRTGKDTVANVLIEHFNFEKYAIANPLKKAVQILFNFDEDQIYGEKKDEVDSRIGVPPRRIIEVFASNLIFNDIYDYIPELSQKIPRKPLLIYRFEWWY
jgi:hypothetical protein